MIMKICAVCGAEFEAKHKNTKYCPNCQAAAYRQQGTQRARARRAEMRESERQFMREQQAKAREEREKEFEKAAAAREKELQAAAASGDLLAALTIAEREPGRYYSTKYWKAYKAYAVDQNGSNFVTVVNSIPVTDPDFEKLVVDSIKATNKFVTHTMKIRQ